VGNSSCVVATPNFLEVVVVVELGVDDADVDGTKAAAASTTPFDDGDNRKMDATRSFLIMLVEGFIVGRLKLFD